MEALKEKLLFKENHEEEVNGLQNWITNCGLALKLDVLKSQNLNKIVADIWGQYEELARKN